MAVIELDRDECHIIRQALNEVCNALDLAEFSTRMGAEHSEALELLDRFRALTNVMDSSGPGRA
jgi:hypothetical protein